MFLPVNMEMVIYFLQIDDVVKPMLLIAKHDNLFGVLRSVSPTTKNGFFGKEGADKFNCHCLMFQLIASKLVREVTRIQTVNNC